MSNTDCCLKCRFFEPLPEQKRSDNVIGSCKANPPFLPKSNESKLGEWPNILGSFWCGVFESESPSKMKERKILIDKGREKYKGGRE